MKELLARPFDPACQKDVRSENLRVVCIEFVLKSCSIFYTGFCPHCLKGHYAHKKVHTLFHFVVSSLPEQQKIVIQPVLNLLQRLEQHSMYKIPHLTLNSEHPPPLRYFMQDFGSVSSYYAFEDSLLQQAWRLYFLNEHQSTIPNLDEVKLK